MQSKTTQEEIIKEFKKKHDDNEEQIKELTKELNEKLLKLQTAEKVGTTSKREY